MNESIASTKPHTARHDSNECKRTGDLNNIVLSGFVIEGKHIPIEGDQYNKLMVKVLYLEPRSLVDTSNPLFHCRKVVHETAALDIMRTSPCGAYEWKSSFLHILSGQDIEEKIILHGNVGDLLFSIYAVDKRTDQRHFIGQSLVQIATGKTRRTGQHYPLVLRDGITEISSKACLRLETEVFLPERFRRMH